MARGRWAGRVHRWSGIVGGGVGVGLLLWGLLLLSFDSVTGSAIGLGLATLTFLVAAFGAEAIGTAAVLLAYATAPMYKGLAPSNSSTVTATDALLAVGFALLIPKMLSGRVRMPFTYLIGVLLVFMAAVTGTVTESQGRLSSLGNLALWLVAMFVLPLVLGLWNPSDRIIKWLVLAYVFGQTFDLFWAAAVNGNQRWTGLSTQPNYFGQAGLLAVATILFLENRLRGWHRVAILGLSALICFGVLQSGSRAATVVLIAVIMAFPLLERSARLVLGVAAAGSLALVGLLLLAPTGGGSNVLSRFLGQGSATGSDAQRSQGLQHGWDIFVGSPITGHGLDSALLFPIHNNYLEVAVIGGVIGFLGYLMVLATLVKPLFVLPLKLRDAPARAGRLGLRRLGYPVLAYIGFGATVPSLYDRSVWSLVALAMLVYQDEAPSDHGGQAIDNAVDRIDKSLEESRV